MKVQEYRDLIDALVFSLDALSSCVTPAERAKAVPRVVRAADELESAAGSCPRLAGRDRERAEGWLSQARVKLQLADHAAKLGV